jgi:hypothetical protein
MVRAPVIEERILRIQVGGFESRSCWWLAVHTTVSLRTYLVCCRTTVLTGAKAAAAPRLSKRAKIVRRGAILIVIFGMVWCDCKDKKQRTQHEARRSAKAIVKLRDVG